MPNKKAFVGYLKRNLIETFSMATEFYRRFATAIAA